MKIQITQWWKEWLPFLRRFVRLSTVLGEYWGRCSTLWCPRAHEFAVRCHAIVAAAGCCTHLSPWSFQAANAGTPMGDDIRLRGPPAWSRCTYTITKHWLNTLLLFTSIRRVVESLHLTRKWLEIIKCYKNKNKAIKQKTIKLNRTIWGEVPTSNSV